MRPTIALLAWLGGASFAVAQDFTIDPHLIDRCLPVVDNQMQCVGQQAYDCIHRNGGGPNMVLGACYEAEAEVWDDWLNSTNKGLIATARDLEASDSGWDPGSLVDTLREMQIAWIAYRDATCAQEMALAKPFGSRVSSVSALCRLRETARQYFELQRVRRDLAAN